MLKSVTLALIVVGVALVAYGIAAAQSLASSLSRIFTGAPTDQAVWLLFAGAALILVGLAGFLRSTRAPALPALAGTSTAASAAPTSKDRT
jgi:hypothetical protein